MKNKNDEVLITFCLSFLLAFFIVGESYLYFQNYKLQKTVETLKVQIAEGLEETEEKCQRMTDTCIDVLANKRWE